MRLNGNAKKVESSSDLVPGESVGATESNGLSIRSGRAIGQSRSGRIGAAVTEIEVAGVLGVLGPGNVVIVIRCNDQEAAVGDRTVVLQIVQVSENVVAVVRFALILLLEKFQFHGAGLRGLSRGVCVGEVNINLCLLGTALSKRLAGQSNGPLKLDAEEFTLFDFEQFAN